MIDIVKMNHDFSDIDLINKWVIAHDTGGDSFLEEAKQKYGGNSLIGFVYVDHQAGISLEIETFCTVGADGDITMTQGPRDHNESLKLRYGVLKQMKIELLSQDQIKSLSLLDRIEVVPATIGDERWMLCKTVIDKHE